MEGHVRRVRFGSGGPIAPLCLLVVALAHRASGQKVKVEAEVLSYPGQTVNLRCAFTNATGVHLTMVMWIYETKDGERLNIAVFLPNFDPNYPESPMKGRVSFSPSLPNLASASIQIQDVRMTDEGRYTCKYATYPSGHERGITNLVMLAKPQNAASTVTVEAGAKAVVVARCESLNGRPEAKIRWVTTANGNATSVSKANVDNTVSIISEYKLVPTAEDNGKDIRCVVEHMTQTKPESFPLKLAVQYASQRALTGYDSNWWVGRQVTVFIREPTVEPSNAGVVACAVIASLLSLLSLLLAAALIAVLMTHSRQQQQGYRSNAGSDMKTHICGGGKQSAKNGTNEDAGPVGVGGANKAPIYFYIESSFH